MSDTLHHPETRAPLACDRCGSPDVFAISPGTAPSIDLFSDIMHQRGQPLRCWCRACSLHGPS